MSTKHDSVCLQKAADNEPIFVLRAQDYLAPKVIRYWADCAENEGTPEAKIAEARRVADEMEAWPRRKMPT